MCHVLLALYDLFTVFLSVYHFFSFFLVGRNPVCFVASCCCVGQDWRFCLFAAWFVRVSWNHHAPGKLPGIPPWQIEHWSYLLRQQWNFMELLGPCSDAIIICKSTLVLWCHDKSTWNLQCDAVSIHIPWGIMGVSRMNMTCLWLFI